MPDSANTTGTETPVNGNPAQHFSAAVEQAKAGAAAAVEQAKVSAASLGKQAQDQADIYRDKLTQQTEVWTDQAKERSDDVIVRAKELAADGKTRASSALSSAAKMIEDNAGLVDDKVGMTYGDQVRSVGRTLQDFADRLDAKDIDEIASDLQAFVRKQPAVAVGIAAASGLVLSRLFAGSKD